MIRRFMILLVVGIEMWVCWESGRGINKWFEMLSLEQSKLAWLLSYGFIILLLLFRGYLEVALVFFVSICFSSYFYCQIFSTSICFLRYLRSFTFTFLINKHFNDFFFKRDFYCIEFSKEKCLQTVCGGFREIFFISVHIWMWNMRFVYLKKNKGIYPTFIFIYLHMDFEIEHRLFFFLIYE